MIYRLSLIKYTKRYEITKATVKYKANRQYIFRWETAMTALGFLCITVFNGSSRRREAGIN